MDTPLSGQDASDSDGEEGGAFVTFQLNGRLQPIHRDASFGHPLEEALSARGIGELDGGGTQQMPTGEVEYCDVVALIREPIATNAAAAAAFLAGLGAPAGSHYRVDGSDDKVPFGVTQGLALYLNGTDLPAETYATADVNELIERLIEALADHGALKSHWRGPAETALYFYGKTFDAMAAAIAPVIASHPLAQQGRVEQIA